MTKAPPNTPSAGDRVKARGRNFVGTLLRVDDRFWAHVRWDWADGPRVCHLHELEKVQEDIASKP